MQALADSAEIFHGGNLSGAARNILAHLQPEDIQDFSAYNNQPQSSSSHKGKTELTITVPRNPTGKRIVASPDSANTPTTPPSPNEGANITVESLAQADSTILGENQPLPEQLGNIIAQTDYQRQPLLHVHSPAQAPVQTKVPEKKKSHARKQPPGHIPRPRNAFILFRKHITDNNLIPKSVEVKHQNISIVASKMWAEAPAEVKLQFTEAARREKEEHARMYPNYRYQPAYRRTDIIRRRVRKDPLEDDKCDAVASLLIQGKAGDELESEVKEKIAEKTGLVDNLEEIKLVIKRGRRKRKDAPGELSKGAIRAEKAAERARAMREHWIDTSMLLAQQTNNHMQRGVHPAQYYEERYQQPNIVYVDAFGRPMYEERFEIPYGNLHHEGEYYPVDTHGNVLPMGPLPAAEQYHEANVRLPRVDEQLPLHMHVPVAIEHQAMGREPQQALEARHVMPGQLPDQVMPYPSQVHVPQQWGPNPELLPFAQQATQAPRQGPLKAQTGFVPEQDLATYALDPLLATNSRDFAVDAYGRVAQETANHNAVDDFRNPPLPSDIIAGRWARDQNTTHENNLVESEHVNGEQAQQRNTDSLLPLMEGEQQLPSHHIDFGEKGELFGGDLNEVFPTDPDIEDYNAALHQQQDMETLLGQM